MNDTDTPAPTAAQTTRDGHEWYTGHHGKDRICRHCGIEAPYQEDIARLDRDVPCVWPKPAPTAAHDAPITAAELDEIESLIAALEAYREAVPYGENYREGAVVNWFGRYGESLVTALRSERAERDADARAIVALAPQTRRDTSLHCPLCLESTLFGQPDNHMHNCPHYVHAKAIEAAKERVKRCSD